MFTFTVSDKNHREYDNYSSVKQTFYAAKSFYSFFIMHI